ncbi:hypothetical protein BDC45DRAFT_512581 [Circinella umbellata]|nr:hypothetical protein BDC45DRAFT_512581 [Circinella umbellata]
MTNILSKQVFTSRLFLSTRPTLFQLRHKKLPYLHFHPISNAPLVDFIKYAVSYLSSKDIETPKEELIIGWTPNNTDIDYTTFLDNTPFVDFLNCVLEDNKIHSINDPQKEGWLHIDDERNPSPWKRIPYPEDIINTDFVKPMPTHCLAILNGIMQLSESLTQCLV